MTCPDMEGRIAGFLAGDSSDRAKVEEHLVACAECRAAFALARAGWEAAAEWKVGVPSADAVTGVLTALEQAPPAPGGFVRFLQVGTLAACLLIAFAVGTSRRVNAPEEPAPAVSRASEPTVPASTGLASLRPSVGLLFAQDEDGRPAGELAIRRLEVRVDIRDGIARTEIEEIFENRTDRRLEGTFQFPLPPDASISRLAMEIDGKLMEGEVVERQKARQTYEGIVRSMKDPALLEWMPGGIFQCRIFPIEPRSDKRIVLAYTQALSVFDGRGRYVYPLSGESSRELGIGRFEFAATVRSSTKLASSGSTSHQAPTIRLDERTMRTSFAHSDFRPRSDFVLAFEAESAGEIQVSAHRPEGAEPGYFAAFITPRPDPEEDRRRDRQLFFFLDASGSVARPELEAARMVVRRMVDALGPADRFRIGSHNLFVGTMPGFLAPDADGKRAAERYLADVLPTGASDVASSLETVLEDVPDQGELVYIGEGTPTWGEKDPATIVARVRAAIGSRRISIRTVAVGSDADRNLLGTLSREFNGGAHAISPSDDVGPRADEIARTLGRSAITNLKAEFEGGIADAAPGTLGSLHFGERLLVTGRYTPGAAKLVLTGRVHDRTIRREFALALPQREAGNLHVKRLWAQRRLADLTALGEARQAEVVKLSVEYQVMTPYTSFLVLENEKAYDDHRIQRTKKDADQTKDPSAKGQVQAPAKAAPVAKTRPPARVDERAAEASYHLALSYYDSGDFERAEAECQKALALNPDHGASNALMMEVQFALGKGRVTPQSKEMEDVIKMSSARQQHVIFEIREAMDNGLRAYNLGKNDDAERIFRTIVEYAKWLPAGKDLDDQRRKASEMLVKLQKPSAPRLQPPNPPSPPPERKKSKLSDAEVYGVSDLTLDLLMDERKPVFDGEALANLIKATIDKSSWNDAQGRSCVFQNGLLVVRNSPEVHHRVRKFLGDLRSSDGTFVSIESRFLTVEDPFAPDSAARKEVRAELGRRRDLELLFNQAQIHFERGQYDQCVDACDRILYLDPRLSSVEEMKMCAQRLVHVKADRDLSQTYVEQWKRSFESIPLNGVPSADALSFPARELWLEVISKRRPKGVLGSNESGTIDVDQEIHDKIRTTQVDLDFTQANVRDVINHIRQVSGLTIELGTEIQDPSAYTYPTLKLNDVTIAAALDIILGGKELAYVVEHGSVHITTAKAQKSWVMLDLHNVQDITYGLQDFPGVNITLEENRGPRRGTLGKLITEREVPLLGDLPNIDFLFRGPSQGGGGALAGVSFSLEEPGEQLGRLLKRIPADLREDGYYSEGRDDLYRWLDSRALPPQVFGVNTSVSIPGTETLSLRLLVDSQTPMPRNAEAILRQLSQVERDAYRAAAQRELADWSREMASTQAMMDQKLAQLQEAERLKKDLGRLEEDYQALARERQRLQETIANLKATSTGTDAVAPRKALSGKVTAVAPELDLVVISIGRDAGVNEGDEFTIYRGKSFLAKITVDRVDRAWASGRVTLKGKEVARIGDEATNNVLAIPGKDASWPAPLPTNELKVLGVSGDDVLLSGAIKHKLAPDSQVMMWRYGSYLSAARVTKVDGNVAMARIIRELHSAPLEKGDSALVFSSLARIWPVLPLEIRQDLVSRAAQTSLRVKLLLLRSLRGGGK